jgi:hypothetical protein
MDSRLDAEDTLNRLDTQHLDWCPISDQPPLVHQDEATKSMQGYAEIVNDDDPSPTP